MTPKPLDLNRIIATMMPLALAGGGLSMAMRANDPRCPACGEPLEVVLRYPPEAEAEPPAPRRRKRRKVAKKAKRGRKR